MSNSTGGRRSAAKKRRGSNPAVALAAIVLAVIALAFLIVDRLGTAKDLPEIVKDVTPPEIHGAVDMSVERGCRLLYRMGVSVTDDTDAEPVLSVDSSAVDLYTPGVYTVIYTATDSSGNETSVSVRLTVTEPAAPSDDEISVDDDIHPEDEPVVSDESVLPEGLTVGDVFELADQILAEITNPDMSLRQKARAIYSYVNSHIKYVGTSDKSSWLAGAYIGFTTGKGDCYNYFACSKALLTRAEIPNVDLERVGGTTSHFWNLVDLGEGYYHFDACPHPTGYPLTAFMITEAEARSYTQKAAGVRKNYYVYDYAACPVEVVQGTAPPSEIEDVTPAEQPPAEQAPADQPPAEQPPAGQTDTPETPPPDNPPDQESEGEEDPNSGEGVV